MTIKNRLRPVYVFLANSYHNLFKAPKRYRNLYSQIKKNKVKTILEVGTWSGSRAKEMIEVAKKNASEKEIIYYGFDLFEDLTDDLFLHELSKKPPTKEDVQNELNTTGVTVELIKGNTLQTLPLFVARGTKVDFVFIDGGHNVETIKSDWLNVQKLMHEKTVVIFDDYWHNNNEQSAKSIVDEIDTNQYNVEILPEIDVFDNSDFGRLEISFAKVTKK